MQLVDGIHHLTFITSDMDQLIEFYERVFEAKTTLDLSEGGARHAFIDIGASTVLHPFEIPGINPPSEPLQMFQRGRLDHFAINASSEEAFREIRNRIIAEGRDDCVVIDMGLLLLFNFTDPDGGEQEVVWWKTEGTEDGVLRENWTYIEDY